MRSIDLPGPLVFQPTTPTGADDLYGGMTIPDMVTAVTAIDPACGLVAAFTGRYIASFLRDHPEHLYADDPQADCCAGTVSTLLHRLDTRHVLNLHAATLTDAVNAEISARIADGETTPDVEVVFDDVLASINEICADLIDLLTSMAGESRVDLLWMVPLLALAVPLERMDAYDAAGLTWPEVLTFETYGPPTTEQVLAALTPSAPVIRLDERRARRAAQQNPARHLHLVP